MGLSWIELSAPKRYVGVINPVSVKTTFGLRIFADIIKL
jgi:hypothetical protein